MSNSDSIREAIERMSQQEKKLVGELNELRVTIRTLKRTVGGDVGAEEIENADSQSADIPDAASPEIASNGGRSTIRPDEFFGATHAEAARRYLKRVGHAVSFAELVDVLRRGGCKLTSSEPEKVLWISLVKNSRDFIPPQPGYVGLREFYPARVRAKQANDRNPTRANRSVKRNNSKSTHSPKQAPKPKADRPDTSKKGNGSVVNPETKAPKQVPLAVHEFMRDKQFHGLDEIVGAVRKKLGGSILPLSVRGALSSKKSFEKNEAGMYRLLV
jgi:Arc/MetJ-type ribon-helix-helix transcriptional regulator